jgi:hypothetical protein
VGLPFAAEVARVQPNIQLVVAALEGQEHHLERLLTHYPLPVTPEVAVSARGDALDDQWGADQLYDFVLLYRKLAYADYGRQYLAKAHQVLAPGGVVIVVEPTTDAATGSTTLLPKLQLMDWLVGGAAAPPLLASADIARLLRRAGFPHTQVVRSTHGLRVVLGWKAA